MTDTLDHTKLPYLILPPGCLIALAILIEVKDKTENKMAEDGKVHMQPPINNKKIGENLNLPFRYVEPFVQKMAKAKILQTAHGKNGGYKLGRPANEISIADVIEAISLTEIPVNEFSVNEIAMTKSVETVALEPASSIKKQDDTSKQGELRASKHPCRKIDDTIVPGLEEMSHAILRELKKTTLAEIEGNMNRYRPNTAVP